MPLGTMKAPKSSASSPRAALKSTSAAATKTENLVRYTTDPQADAELERGKRRRLAALRWRPEASGDVPDEDERPIVPRGPSIQPAKYPAVPIDARVVEWFMKQSGDSATMMFDINYVLLDYITEQEKKAAKNSSQSAALPKP